MDDLAKVAAAGDGESLEQVRGALQALARNTGWGEHVPRALWVGGGWGRP
jgi:hypothetical protein